MNKCGIPMRVDHLIMHGSYLERRFDGFFLQPWYKLVMRNERGKKIAEISFATERFMTEQQTNMFETELSIVRLIGRVVNDKNNLD